MNHISTDVIASAIDKIAADGTADFAMYLDHGPNELLRGPALWLDSICERTSLNREEAEAFIAVVDDFEAPTVQRVFEYLESILMDRCQNQPKPDVATVEARHSDGEGPECPHCERVHVAEDNHFFEDNRFTLECDNCEREFYVWPTVSVSWRTESIT